MSDTKVTDEQIDARICAWGFEGGWKGLAEELGVDISRVNERWNRFREHTYELLEQGLTSQEIADQVGIPKTAIAAFRANRTRRLREETAEQQVALEFSVSFERDLQVALRSHIRSIDDSLSIVDGGTEKSLDDGRSRVDILAEDGKGNLVVIELKVGTARDDAIGQILGYMGQVSEERGRKVRGILIAKGFKPRVISAASQVSNLELKSYSINFEFGTPGAL